MAIKLGDKVRDRVSGSVGVAVCRAEWINGCVRWSIQRKADKEGKAPDLDCFDEKQLEVVKSGEVKIAEPSRTGGPMPVTPPMRNQR